MPTMIILLRFVLAVLLGVLWITGVSAKIEREVAGLVALINTLRSDRLISPLRTEAGLARIARDLTDAIYQGQTLDRLADGVENLLREQGYPFQLYGIRFATTDLAADEMIRGWLREGGKDSILLDSGAMEIGAAFKSGAGSPVKDMASGIWAVIIAEPAIAAREGWKERVLSHINAFRARNSLKPLKLNSFLNRAALGHARDMLVRDFFSHISPEGLGPGDRATKVGYRWSIVLENIAVGQRTAHDVVDAWIASKEGHREAMLNDDVTEVGVGYAFGPYDTGRIDGRHYWAVMLGLPQQPF